LHGSEILAKDVLEYIVFEKHLSNEYGLWRLHEKIVPNWMPPKEPIAKTYRLVKEKVSEESSETKEVQTTPSGVQVERSQVAAV
jgi:large subunit ribosomal protein L45